MSHSSNAFVPGRKIHVQTEICAPRGWHYRWMQCAAVTSLLTAGALAGCASEQLEGPPLASEQVRSEDQPPNAMADQETPLDEFEYSAEDNPEGGVQSAHVTAGSFINVGVTEERNGAIKGSGSMHNTGDYSTVCVVIVGQLSAPGNGPGDWSKKCHSEIGDIEWSAPDVRKPLSGCAIFLTEVRSYINGTRNQTKKSNTIAVCP